MRRKLFSKYRRLDMTKIKGLVKLSLLGVAAGIISFTGCTRHASDEEMQQLDNLRQEVSSLQKSVNDARQEQTKIQREQGEQKARLDQCAKDKEQTARNLEQLPK
jgi:septal ring factor EnvC (AmiA/AmiB activator)